MEHRQGSGRHNESLYREGLLDVKDVQADDDDPPVMATSEGIIFGVSVTIGALLLIAAIGGWL